jgi:ring-1,2-phenylacetyl-CoA epoxidase subunit PaaC
MSIAMTEQLPGVDAADELSPESRSALRDLILALADSKRMLGLRYSDRMLGAPSLEAGIAMSSMAQDEWGHARLTYALLSDFGDEPKRLEHERSPGEYRSLDVLDRSFESWSEMIAGSLLIDTALTTQYAALSESRYRPVYNRVQKLLDEEGFHFQYAAGWTRRIAAAGAARAEFATALRAMLPAVLRWFGRSDSEGLRRLASEGIVRCGADEMRRHFLAQIAPILDETGLAAEIGLGRSGEEWAFGDALSWDDWDEARRRGSGDPGEELVGRARGDKNRALLMD